VQHLSELEGGRTIGALFLSTGSDRLKLQPGIYRVFILKKNDQWRVQFFDASDHQAGETDARVVQAEKVMKPYAYVDHSVCVRLDETLICF
jgi:hypothetical protein